MEIRVCPECNKAFYASRDAESLACSFCGHVLYDRRGRERMVKHLDFLVSFSNGTLPAKLIDYSASGLKAVYKGGEFKADTVLQFDIGELNIHTAARIIWTKKVSKSVYASGFEFLN